ncbi:TonB-dependent siderophore receptor [Shewanella sp. NIFS-20-20]|uniref:TonB-dependent receptor plug domain-containing protein n=1 Tax=Shewanella sp. NIFS-20-20 TaxID=2853806 RepID=UPI00210DE8F2|nr:TonB-dependent receptor [Shewanella sp. NIFS-20-20]
MDKNKINKAIRFALISGVATAAFSTPTLAAEAGADKVERIEVTGSRIQRTDMETATPVTIFSAEDIDKTGFSTVSEFLRTTAASGGFNESSTLSQAAGASSVGLRGFSPDYTLILLNGRRLPKNSAGGIFTDVNQLPIAAVARIEVLPDGASAIYGSDAVAGVINIITKTDFDGLDFSARYGAAIEHMDADEANFSLVAGASNDTTNILFAAEYFERKPIEAVDRKFGSTANIEGHEGGNGQSTWGIPGFTLIGGQKGTVSSTQGTAPWSDCPADDILSNGRCAYDFAPLYQIQPASDRQSIFTAINHEFSDDLTMDGQFRYSRAYTRTSNAPSPGAVEVTNSPYLYDFLLNDRYKDDQVTGQQVIDELKAGDAYVYVGRRYLDFPNRQKDNTNETFESVVGLNYNIDDNWNLDYDLGFSRLTNRQIGAAGQLLIEGVEDAFANGDLNPFVINDCSSPELSQTCKDLQASIHRTGEYKMTFSSLVLSGMAPIELWGGDIGLATGLDYRKEEYSDRSDPASVAGQVIGGAGSNGGGSATNYAGFVEVSLPVLDNLEVNLAARHDMADWEVNDDSKTTYSAKVAYTPIDELLLRASYGTGFKAPSLDSLYLNESSGVQFAIDTKLCNAAGNNPASADCKRLELNSKSGGNVNLESETSESYNLGAVYQITDDLSFSIDYWSLTVDNIVGSLSIQEILDAEAVGELTELVVRNAQGRLDDSARTGYVRTNLQNLTEQSAKGLTYDLQYSGDFSFGGLSAVLRAEQYLSYKTQSSAVQPLCDWAEDDAMEKWRLNGNVTYTVGDVATTLNARWLQGYDQYQKRNTGNNSCQLVGWYDVGSDVDANGDLTEPGRAQHVGSYVQFDLTSVYNIDNHNKVTMGIRNLLDRQPSFSDPYSWPFYDQGSYDNIGRFVYLQYDVSF